MPILPLLQAALRFAALLPEERAFAASAWVAAPVVRASLALVGLKGTLRWVEGARPVTPRSTTRDASASRRRAARVSVAAGSALVSGAFRAHLTRGADVARGQCLPRSVVQYLLHRRDGVPARLVVGVKRAGPGAAIEAHAWVEASQASGREGASATGFEPHITTGSAEGSA